MQAFGSEMDIFTAWFFMGNITCRGVYRGGGALEAKPPWISEIFSFKGFLGHNGC